MLRAKLSCFIGLTLSSYLLHASETIVFPTKSKVQHYSDTQESTISFVSAIKKIAHVFYAATRYALGHPKQLLALGVTTHLLPIAAQTGNDFAINQYYTYNQDYPAVAVLANGNVLVAWVGIQAGTSDIYGRIMSSNGTGLNDEFLVNQITTGTQQFPSVARLNNGNVFIAWQGDQTGNEDIYARIFYPNGTALGNEFFINEITTDLQLHPSVASLTNGNVFIVWQGEQTGDGDIYGRVFSPNGVALGTDLTINQITANFQQYASVCGLTNGNVFVTWEGYQTNNFDVYARVLLPNGGALGNEFRINQVTNSSDSSSSVTCLSDGTVFVAWYSDQFVTLIDIIKGRSFSSTGTPLGNEFAINEMTSNNVFQPAVKGLPDGTIFVAWYGDQAGSYDIYGRVLFSDGMAQGTQFIINQDRFGTQRNPSIGVLTNGTMFVAWDSYQGGVTGNIIGRYFFLGDLATQYPPSSLLLSALSSPSTAPTPTGQLTSTPAVYSPSSLATLSNLPFSSNTGLPTSSLELSDNPIDLVPAAIGGALGGTALIGAVVGGIIAGKRRCFSQVEDNAVKAADIELAEKNASSQSLSSEGDFETPGQATPAATSPSSTPGGFADHPTSTGHNTSPIGDSDFYIL